MDQINGFVDERQKAWCIRCGAWIGDVDTNRDHVPSKVLLRKPYPENLPVVATCVACNNGFSADEEYLHLFLHCVLTRFHGPGAAPGRQGRARYSATQHCARGLSDRRRSTELFAARRVASGSPKWREWTVSWRRTPAATLSTNTASRC